MNFYVALGLDVVTVLVVGYCIYAATKKGFLRTVVQMVAYVLILVAASVISRSAAPIIYDRVVEPMLFERQNASLQGEKANAALVSLPGSIGGGGEGIWDLSRSLPKASGGKGGLLSMILDYFDPEELDRLLEENGLEEITDDFLRELAESTVRPMAISGLSMIGFVLLFGLLSILTNLLLSTLGVIRYVPVIGKVNAFLGGVVGALQAVLLLWLAAQLLQSMLLLNQGSWWIFTENIVDRTYLFRHFNDLSLLRELMAGL